MSDEEAVTPTPSMMEVMQLLTQMSMALNNNNLIINNLNNNINDINNTMNNNMNNLRAEINSKSDATRIELLERLNQRSRLSSRATSSKQLALRHVVILTATIPVVTAPIIVTALKTSPLHFAVPDNETHTVRDQHHHPRVTTVLRDNDRSTSTYFYVATQYHSSIQVQPCF